ncbi:MAG TPA: hypothetical protein VIJ35_24650 [Bradyrhizobium sp.]
MSGAKPKAPSTNCGQAGAAIARVNDGRGTIGIMIMVMVMTTAEAVTAGGPARIVVPANGSNAHGQDDRAKDGGVGAASGNNGSLVRRRAGRRRLANSAITGGQS